MQLFEKIKNYPIKFYKTAKGEIEFESPYMNGRAHDLNSAMYKIADAQEKLLFDLYNFDDVIDVEIGQYQIADKPRKSRGREYLGQISVKIETNDWTGDNTLKHVALNPASLRKHQDLVSKWWKQRQKEKFLQKLQNFIQKLNPFVTENRSVFMNDSAKNYVLSLLRAESAAKEVLEEQSLNENVDIEVDSSGSAQGAEELPITEELPEWGFNAHDEGMSGSATYVYNKPVILFDHEDDGIQPLDTIDGINVVSPDLKGAEGQSGYFMLLKTPEGQYGFEADFGEDYDTMIYSYADDLEELKILVDLFGNYASIPEEIPFDEFEKLASAEEPVMEGSKFYTFTVSCPVTFVVRADSEDLAKELLVELGSAEFDSADSPELADGAATIAAIEIDPNEVRSSFAHNEFDPEQE